MSMKLTTREVNGVTIVDLSGKITLGEGGMTLRDVLVSPPIWFDDQPTKQTGELRTYSSPPLESGQKYHYVLRAQWDDNGKTQTASKRVEVGAGKVAEVDFTRP